MGEAGGRVSDGDEDYTPLVPQVRVRIGVDCATVADFVERYGRFVDGDRIFIATDAVEAPGALVQVRVDLADGRAAIHGTGTVLQARAEAADGAPRGMLLRFVAMDEPSARVVEAMAARRGRSTPTSGVPSLERARGWHTQSVERERVLPANPFGDVPDAALAYFVDWSLERNGSLSLRRGPRAVAFAAVRMQAPRRRRARPPSWVPFVVGVITGCVVIVALIDATRELERVLYPPPRVERSRVVAVAPTPSPTPPSPTPPSPTPPPRSLPPSPSPSSGGAGDAPLAIAAEPSAVVLVDGQRVGKTPLVVAVLRGAHVVELARPRYQTARLDVDAPGRASVRLERPRATLHVTSSVADAEVLVDGEAIGRAPVYADVAGYERCRVDVRAPDGRAWHKRVYVRPPLTDLAATFAAE